MRFSNYEIKEIVKAWIAVSLIFAIAITGISSKLFVALPLTFLTAGIGFLFDNSIALDIGYARGFWDTSHLNYSGYDKNRNLFSTGTTEHVRINHLVATFAYRF